MKKGLLFILFCIICLQSYAQSAVSLFNKGYEYFRNKDYNQAFSCYLQSAKQGYIKGQYMLALCYHEGYGVSKNSSKAFEWFLKSAEQGDDMAQYWTGVYYFNGYGIERDAFKGVYWLKKSAEKGLMEGQSALAACYFKGEGTSQNLPLSFYWYGHASLQGDNYGKYIIDYFYNKGFGGKKDMIDTINFLESKANDGDVIAQRILGEMYYRGDGIEMNPLLGEKYLRKAANKGDRKAKSLLEDVLHPIPCMNPMNDNTFAIVIINEQCQNYSRMLIDESIFKEYLQRTLGLKEKQIKILENPSLSDIIVTFDWIKNVTEAYNGETKVLVYYTGPGISDESTGEPFILPSDADALDPLSGYSVDELCETFGNMKTKSTIIILDACFNGARSDGTMIASARGVAIKSKSAVPQGNMVLLTASRNDETAYAITDYRRGIFTTKLLQKLKETKGEATLGEIYDFASREVSKNIILEKGKPQTPQVIVSSQLGDSWRKWKLNR